MSFTQQIKEELCRLGPGKDCCARAECYGMLLFAAVFSQRRLRVHSDLAAVRGRVRQLLRRCAGVEISPRPDGTNALVLEDPPSLRRVFSAFGYEFEGTALHLNRAVVEEDCCRIAFLRGAFLTGGYVSDVYKRQDVYRPGLQLVGFYDHFDAGSIQVLGKVEWAFLQGLDSHQRERVFELLFEKKIPLLIFARDYEPFPECLAMAEKYGVPVAGSGEYTTDLMAAMTSSLHVHLGPTTTLHGVLVEVYGEGILLLGGSGIGKSETAIELVKRGHRLIADDAVDIKKVSAKTLVGSAPEMIRYFIELRGIGIIDVRRIFGMGSVKPTERVDLVAVSYTHLDVYKRQEEMVALCKEKCPNLQGRVQPVKNDFFGHGVDVAGPVKHRHFTFL